jgi:hypothetical protein
MIVVELDSAYIPFNSVDTRVFGMARSQRFIFDIDIQRAGLSPHVACESPTNISSSGKNQAALARILGMHSRIEDLRALFDRQPF